MTNYSRDADLMVSTLICRQTFFLGQDRVCRDAAGADIRSATIHFTKCSAPHAQREGRLPKAMSSVRNWRPRQPQIDLPQTPVERPRRSTAPYPRATGLL